MNNKTTKIDSIEYIRNKFNWIEHIINEKDEIAPIAEKAASAYMHDDRISDGLRLCQIKFLDEEKNVMHRESFNSAYGRDFIEDFDNRNNEKAFFNKKIIVDTCFGMARINEPMSGLEFSHALNSVFSERLSEMAKENYTMKFIPSTNSGSDSVYKHMRVSLKRFYK